MQIIDGKDLLNERTNTELKYLKKASLSLSKTLTLLSYLIGEKNKKRISERQIISCNVLGQETLHYFSSSFTC
jgi:hypothetical protein